PICRRLRQRARVAPLPGHRANARRRLAHDAERLPRSRLAQLDFKLRTVRAGHLAIRACRCNRGANRASPYALRENWRGTEGIRLNRPPSVGGSERALDAMMLMWLTFSPLRHDRHDRS